MMKQRKNKGKKKFGKYYLFRFVICLLAVGAFGGYQLQTLWQSEKDFYKKDFDERHWSIAQDMIDTAEKDTENKLQYRVTMLTSHRFWLEAGYEYGAVFFQPETGEAYYSESFALAVVHRDGKQERYYLYDQDLVDRLWETGNTRGHNYPLVYSIYIKDGEFVPGEVYQRHEEYNVFTMFTQEKYKIAGEWIDLSPENTDGWTKVCSTAPKEEFEYGYYGSDGEERLGGEGDPNLNLRFCVIGGSPASPLADAVLNEIKEYMPSYREAQLMWLQEDEKQLADGELTEEDLYQYNADTEEEYAKAIQKSYITGLKHIPEKIASNYILEHTRIDDEKHKSILNTMEYTFRDETWVLFTYEYVDLPAMYLAEHLPFIIPHVVLTFPIAAIIALLWAVIGYLIYSKRYDLDTYRRTLTAALAHDLKTPLAVISGYAENLREHTHPEKADVYADGIMENVQHMDAMIAGVLGLAKLESGVEPDMKDGVDMTGLLHAAFERSAVEMTLRELTLTESGSLTVHGNAEMLRQLAENLAANAVQHTAKGGAITVTAEGKTLRISNPFTGELDEKTLCEPFKRGDSARGRQSGSGLGLSYVKLIASLHKCRLHITAKDGVFTVTLRFR